MPYETGAVPPTRLFVGGLAPGVSAMQLKEIFEPHGDIVRMQVKDTDKDVCRARLLMDAWRGDMDTCLEVVDT